MGEDGPLAVRAFGTAADTFDARFGEWRSVAAQRRAVRGHLGDAFPPGAHLLELGGGTGEDALWLAERGYRVTLTDGSPEMVERAREKVERAGLADRVETATAVLEDLDTFAADRRADGPFDGAYSNFASLNCVEDLRPVARGLAALLPPGATAALVVFGPFAPGEVLVQLLRGDPAAAFRRLERGPVQARLGGVPFSVWYPSPTDVRRAFEPEFRLVETRGIGVFVPPSAAEPWISRHPRLLGLLERLDRYVERPLARLGDHVLLRLERTEVPAERVEGGAPRSAVADHAPAGTDGSGLRPQSPEFRPSPSPDPSAALRRFRQTYGQHRAAEGRGGADELLALPYLSDGPTAPQWAVRARTFDRFVSAILAPRAEAVRPRRLDVLDLGAGPGWLARRVVAAGHRGVAVDVRTDAVDGLGAAEAFRGHEPGIPPRIAASFEALPLDDGGWDLAVFNASLHYALALDRTLTEAVRVLRPGGRIVVLDSPFYRAERHGAAMVEEKRRTMHQRFGERADDLMAPPFIEFLTADRVAAASRGLGLTWRRHRVRYPMRYELRGPLARLAGRRPSSRFDMWEGSLA